MLPKTLDDWYLLGMRVLEYFCKQVNCGREPSIEACKDCYLRLLGDNLSFRYEMQWRNLLVSLVLSFKSDRERIIKEAKKRLCLA